MATPNRRKGETLLLTLLIATTILYSIKPTKAQQNPVAGFAYSPDMPYVGDVVTFNASASYDPDGWIVSYEWDFGDGTVETTTEPLIDHTYSDYGVFTVNLTVTDDQGLTSSVAEDVKIRVTKVWLDYNGQPNICDETLAPGATFTVNLTISYIQMLSSFQFVLGEPTVWSLDPEKYRGWDPSVLHLESVELGPFLGSRGGTVVWSPGEINNTQGTLSLTIAYLDPNQRWPTGGGVLAHLTFQVVGVGATPIRFGLDTALLNRTGGYMLGPDWDIFRPTATETIKRYGHAWRDWLIDGYFDNRPIRADLVRRSAWPEHHHYSLSKDEDSYQTLWGKVKNLGEAEVYIKVVFDITNEGGSTLSGVTQAQLVEPGQILDLHFDFGPLSAADVAKYAVTAKCLYSRDGNRWLEGEKIKSFSFSIVS